MTLLRQDGKVTFYQIETFGTWGGKQQRWTVGYLRDWMVARRPEEHGLDAAFAYGPSGEVWQTTGHHGTYSLQWAQHLLEAARTENTLRGKDYPIRLVQRVLTQETIVIEEGMLVAP